MQPLSLHSAARFYSERACYPLDELPDGCVTLSASPARSTAKCCLWLCVMPDKALVSCRESMAVKIEGIVGDIGDPVELMTRTVRDRLIAAIGGATAAYEGTKLVCDESSLRSVTAEGVRRLTPERAPGAIHDLASVGIPNDVGYLLHDGCAHASFVGQCAVSFAATHPCEVETIGDMMVGTLPMFRRQGHGRAVTSAATQEVLRQGKIAVWGSESSNRAAIKTAESCGYERFCRVLEIREV